MVPMGTYHGKPHAEKLAKILAIYLCNGCRHRVVRGSDSIVCLTLAVEFLTYRLILRVCLRALVTMVVCATTVGIPR